MGSQKHVEACTKGPAFPFRSDSCAWTIDGSWQAAVASGAGAIASSTIDDQGMCTFPTTNPTEPSRSSTWSCTESSPPRADERMCLDHGCEKPLTLDPDMLSALESEFEPANDSDGSRQSSTSMTSMKILYHNADQERWITSSRLRNNNMPLTWATFGSGMNISRSQGIRSGWTHQALAVESQRSALDEDRAEG
jgi:hypothetical protein